MTQPMTQESTEVRFVVIVPDPPELQPETIYVAMSLDGWSPVGRPLERIAPGVYAASWPFVAGAPFEYKFIREQSWTTVEKGPAGDEVRNRALTVARLPRHVVVHTVARWADRADTDDVAVEVSHPGRTRPVERKSTLTGDVRPHYRFHSPQLKNDRTVLVYVPPGYDDTLTERYPVLYMHDGQNVFDAATSFAGAEWEADETAERLITEGLIEKIIVVAIYNSPDRIAEYTPFRDKDRGGGSGDAYLEFIVDTLKPFIDRNYRTLPDREHTAIAGSSLGGLLSLYAPFARPEVFGRAAAVSPTLPWAETRVVKYIERVDPVQPLRLWLDVGTEESYLQRTARKVMRLADSGRMLRTALHEKGYVEERDLHYEEVAGGRHSEKDWAARFGRILIYLFGVEQPPRKGDG